LNLLSQVGDLQKPQPLAILNAEEVHWQAASVSHIIGVGSIIVHSVTNPAELFPPPRGILA